MAPGELLLGSVFSNLWTFFLPSIDATMNMHAPNFVRSSNTFLLYITSVLQIYASSTHCDKLFYTPTNYWRLFDEKRKVSFEISVSNWELLGRNEIMLTRRLDSNIAEVFFAKAHHHTHLLCYFQMNINKMSILWQKYIKIKLIRHELLQCMQNCRQLFW